MADETPQRKQINFTIVPDDQPGEPRTYANFCSIAHTPFDFTLTFCEVMPLSEKELRDAEADHVVRAPVRARVVVPVQFVPNLVAALQEHMRVFSESVYGIPPEQVIGTMFGLSFKPGADGKLLLIRETEVLLNDDEAGKPEGIHLVIGRTPQFAFGNSAGDREMLEYATAGAPGPG